MIPLYLASEHRPSYKPSYKYGRLSLHHHPPHWKLETVLGYVPEGGTDEKKVMLYEFSRHECYKTQTEADLNIFHFRYFSDDKSPIELPPFEPSPEVKALQISPDALKWRPVERGSFQVADATVPGVLKLQPIVNNACAPLGLLPPEVPPNAGVFPFDRENWMSQMAKSGLLDNITLNYLCLPGTHDSATANLTLELTDAAPPDINKTITTTVPIILGVSVLIAPILGGIIASTVEHAIHETTRNLAKATSKSIHDQLMDGIRAFDLRVFYDKADGNFYSVHSVKGESHVTILDQIANFLDSHPGEILYAWFRAMPHLSDGGVDDDKVLAKFGEMLYSKLGDYAVRRSDTGKSSPFEMKYKDLVGKHGRIIIQFDKMGPGTDVAEDGAYKIQGKAGDICYCLKEMNIINQYSTDFPHADGTLMVWLKRAPNPDEAKNVGMSDVKHDVLNILQWIPIVGAIAYPIVENVLPDNTVGFRSLREIAEPINRKLPSSLVEIEARENVLSGIFGDFYENSSLVDLAIARSYRQVCTHG